MTVGTPLRPRAMRLAGMVAAAAIGAAAIVGLAETTSRAGAGAHSSAISHVPSKADVDFAHRAFDQFRDTPEAPAFSTADHRRGMEGPRT